MSFPWLSLLQINREWESIVGWTNSELQATVAHEGTNGVLKYVSPGLCFPIGTTLDAASFDFVALPLFLLVCFPHLEL